MELEKDSPFTEDPEANLPPTTFSEADIERLGKQRPDAFRTSFAEIGFCFSLLSSMFMAVGAFTT
jgi:hypothetical protein